MPHVDFGHQQETWPGRGLGSRPIAQHTTRRLLSERLRPLRQDLHVTNGSAEEEEKEVVT